MHETRARSPLGTNTFKLFRAMNAAVSYATDQFSILKPEVAILLELHEAEHQRVPIKSSAIGLTSGIPQTTANRYLKVLEDSGMIFRYRHLTDQRVTYVRLAPAIVAKLDRIFFGEPHCPEAQAGRANLG